MTFTGRSLFSLIIALLMGYMVVASFEYGFRARVFPAALGSLMFVMALLQFVADTFPGFSNKLRFLTTKGVALDANAARPIGQESPARTGEPPRPPASWSTVYGIFASLAVFAVLMSFTSFLVAVPAFLLLYVRFAAQERFAAALGLAGGILLFMYAIFKLILRSTF